MKKILLLTILALALSLNTQAEDIREACFIRATVVPLDNGDTHAIATSTDSRFDIKLRISDFIMGSPLLDVEDEQVFAIHSLATMFPEDLPNLNTESIEGNKYMFFFTRTTSKDGTIRYNLNRGEYLYEEVIKREGEQVSTGNRGQAPPL